METVYQDNPADSSRFLSGQMKYKDESEDIKREDLKDTFGGGKYDDTFDAFSLAVGVGADFNLTEALYLRGALTWNFRLDDKQTADARDAAFNLGYDYESATSGPRVKLAVGYKF